VSFATWLWGLRAEQPGEYRRLMAIRRRIYRKVGTLTAEVVRSAEPIPFDELDRSAFRRLRTGGSWGKTLDCAWLRVSGEVPAGAEGAVVMLGIRGEGLVCTAEGEVVDSVSTVFQQGDLPHSGGRYRPVPHLAIPAHGRFEFFADVAYNGFLLYPVGRGVFDGAHLAVRDDDAYRLYYDYLTLVVLAGHTEDAALATRLRAGLRAAYARFRARDIRGARAALAGLLAAHEEPGSEPGVPGFGDFEYSAIGHGHLDQAWLWPIRETRRKAVRTYTRQLGQLDDRPGYLYGTSQPQQLLWTKQGHPAVYERIKKAVAAGRMELQGSFWVETDTNMPGGESLVRQSLVGRRFLAEEFGLTADDMRLCWLPDTFGYSGNLPQILKKSGMDWFQTIKLAWNKVTVFPHRTFTWQGIDGSSVLVHMPPEGDYNSRAAADGLLRGLKQYPEKALGTALLVFGSGDGGGGPGEIHLELIEREHNLRGLPRVEYSTASDFFRRLEKLPIAHTHRGELYLETHQGTYTTQAETKRRNRRVERKLHDAEALAAITGSDSRAVLDTLWREVLLHHFHDILPGSSITRVNREAVETLTRIEGALDEYIAQLTAELPHDGDAPAALNLTSMPRSEHVEIDGAWFEGDFAPYASARLRPVGAVAGLGFTDDTMTNGLISVRFGRSGEIESFTDAGGAEQSAAGLNRLVLHRDPYQWPFDAWDIGMGYLQRAPRVLRAAQSSTRVDGPRVVRTQRYRFGRSTVEQQIILEAGSESVRFETTVDWHETHRMLRAEFRPAHFGDTVRCEIQFGHIERTTLERDEVERAQFEVCAHKWVAVQDAESGFALLNDSKYGHRVKNGLISLNLLRAPTFPDKTADRGIHRFAYAMRPFATGDLAGVVRDGYRLNNPVLVAPGAVMPSAVSTDDPGVIVETVKPAENGDGVIVRLYESLGRPAVTALRTGLPHRSARETNLMELPLDAGDRGVDLGRLEFTPFEIKTIHLQSTKTEA